MKQQVSFLSRSLLILMLIFSVSIMKALPVESDSTLANALSFLQARPETTHFEYSENPAMIVSMSLGVGNNVWTNELYTVDPADPGSAAVLTGTVAVSASGDFAPGDPDHMWVIDLNDSHLKRLNVNTGLTDQEVILNHSFTDGAWTVLSINKATGEFYGVATDGSASEVYLIDPVSGTTTPIMLLEIPAIVSGTFDGGNQLFLFDILNDEMWVLDVQTNSIALLGNAGFDGNYAQGMGFDPLSGDIYLAAYDNVEGPQLRVLDQLSGNTTLLGALPGETTGFGFTEMQQQDLYLQAGLDHYTVPFGTLAFGEDLPEIPQGFFGPGSEPFTGPIILQGTNSQGGMQAQQDATVSRLNDVPTPEPLPATSTVPIEMISLSLTGIEPITVQTGTGESDWYVQVQLSDGMPSQGFANINRQDLNGGDFNMELFVQPVLIFTSVDDPTDVRILDPIEFGFEGLSLMQPNPFGWMAPPIPNEFDPFGEEGLNLVTQAGNEILFVPFLVREDNFFLSMDGEGQPEEWAGTGYNNSEWYYYPYTDWWNVWFYDHPLDVTRHKLVTGNLQILPRDASLPSYVEIIVNWSTPEWPQWPGFPEVPFPPLPDLMVSPEYESQVIERSEPIFIWEQTISEPVDVPIPSDYLNNFTGLFNFNPEWISIDIRGFNFVVTGELIHICFKPWTGCEVICPDDFLMCETDDPINLMDLVSPPGGTFAGGNIFDPSTAPPGVPLQFKYTYTDPITGETCSCVFYITVMPSPEVVCPDDFTMCADDAPIDLMGLVSPAGGTFSGGRIFDPSTAPPGVPLQIRYTYVDPDTGCEASCIFYITVWPNPNVDCPADKQMCIDDPAITLTAAPAGGTYSGPGISGASFDPFVAGVGVHTIEYCYTDPQTGCEGCCDFIITVHDLPDVECPDDKDVCVDDDEFILAGATPAGGTYSNLAGTALTKFDPATAGVGIHSIFYDYTDPDTGCSNWCVFFIEVHPLPDVQCPDDIEVCANDPMITLGGATPAGGTYSDAFGNAITKFNPATAGVGVHAIFYDYTDPDTGCSNWCVFFIDVLPLPNVVCPADFAVCEDDPAFALAGGAPAGGVYSGTGVAGGMFNPAGAGDGVHTIKYTYTDPLTGCTNSCSFKITVHELPDVDCPANITVCDNNPAFLLAGATPAGGTYSDVFGPIVMFNPAVWGVGVHAIFYDYTDPATGCSNWCMFTITVVAAPVVTCPPNITVCENDPSFDLTGGTPAGGVYTNPAGTTVTKFYPATSIPGLYTYTYTDPLTGCSNSCTFTITVVASPNVICPPNQIVCIDNGPIVLAGGLPAGGWYVGPGVAGGVFNPLAAGVGVKAIKYFYTDPITGCTGSCTFTITVNPLPNVVCPPNMAVCEDDPAFALAGAIPAGGAYSIGGIPIAIFNPATAALGANLITYTYTDPNTGCTNTCSFTITVNPIPVVVCPPDTTVHVSDTAWALTGGTPAGGVYTNAAGNAIATFDPAIAGIGNHPVTYEYTDVNGCSDSCTFIITVTGQQDDLDFGDAPDGIGGYSYNTLLANMGARHVINPDIYLGNRIDGEADGQPTFGADGDDLAAMDDEDGVTLPLSVTPGSTVTIAVKASVDGYLDGWMDFNLDGTWMGPSEHIFTSQFVVAGVNALSFTVPAGANYGETYIRFRYRDYAGAITYSGLVQNGEVEDYRIKIDEEPQQEMDFGDAPDNGAAYNYHTLVANNGARHIIDPDVFMGNLIDAEADGQPNIPALGDDNNNLDDEDGVRMRRFMAVGDVAKVRVKASVDGYLNAWIDFNRDGDWSGPGEQIFTDALLVAGWNTLTFMVPDFAEKGRTYARFRFNTAGGLTFEGPAEDGEVEDYLVAIFPENWGFEITDLSHLIVVPVHVNQVLKGSDSYSLMPDDFLGVFFDDNGEMKCGGAISWQGDENQVLLAYGDDPTTPDKEGFDEGELMNFKVSVAATGEEFDAQVAFDPDQPNADGAFQNNGLSALTGIELVGTSQTLEIAEGWSGISTFIEPLNTNVEAMFAPVANDLVVLYKLNGSMYWPAENLNTMGQWDAYDGHVIKMNQDALLEVSGTELADKTVQLQQGLNLIPVLSTFPVDIEMLFSTAPGVILVKEVAGSGVWLPDWNINTIGAVVPGSAYFVLTNQAGIISYDLGSNKSGTVYAPSREVYSPWNTAENTPGSHVVVFNLSGDVVQQGDVIGGFTADGHCAGIAIADGETFALSLNPDDPFDEGISGFEDGDQIVLKLYRDATGEVFVLEAEYTDRFDQLQFVGNGLSEVTGLKTTASGTTGDLAAEINVYPNPSSGIFNLSNAEDVELIEVMDSYGKLIISEKPGFDRYVDLSDHPTGIYFLKAIAKDGSESTHKLIVR